MKSNESNDVWLHRCKSLLQSVSGSSSATGELLSGCYVGKSMVLYRNAQHRWLEQERSDCRSRAVVLCQKFVRSGLVRRNISPLIVAHKQLGAIMSSSPSLIELPELQVVIDSFDSIAPYIIARTVAGKRLDAGREFQIKRISVNQGASLSLQLHHHRAEHWVVVNGVATVTIDKKVFKLNKNESCYIPPETRHRLQNLSEMSLEIVEVQSGSYLGEDDIVRFDDNYGR